MQIMSLLLENFDNLTEMMGLETKPSSSVMMNRSRRVDPNRHTYGNMAAAEGRTDLVLADLTPCSASCWSWTGCWECSEWWTSSSCCSPPRSDSGPWPRPPGCVAWSPRSRSSARSSPRYSSASRLSSRSCLRHPCSSGPGFWKDHGPKIRDEKDRHKVYFDP